MIVVDVSILVRSTVSSLECPSESTIIGAMSLARGGLVGGSPLWSWSKSTIGSCGMSILSVGVAPFSLRPTLDDETSCGRVGVGCRNGPEGMSSNVGVAGALLVSFVDCCGSLVVDVELGPERCQLIVFVVVVGVNFLMLVYGRRY